VFPFTLIAWAEQSVDAGLATILNSSAPIFTFLLTWYLSGRQAATAGKTVRRRRRHGRHLPDRGRRRTVGPSPSAGRGLAIVAATVCLRGRGNIRPPVRAHGSDAAGGRLDDLRRARARSVELSPSTSRGRSRRRPARSGH
jgi:hypothetical protein